MMRIAMMESCFPNSDRQDAVRLAAEEGAAGLELILDDCRALVALEDAASVAEVTEMARAAGLAIPSLAVTAICRTDGLVRQSDATAPAMRLVQSAMTVAAALNAPVVLLPFFGKAAISEDSELHFLCDRLGELGEQAEPLGVTLGVESMLSTNHKIFLTDHTGGIGVRHYCDVANVVLRRRDPATEIRELGADRICQVHFKDVLLRENQPPDTNVLLGQGQVHFPAVTQALKAIGYDGWVCLETPGLSDPVATAKANMAFTRKVLGIA